MTMEGEARAHGCENRKNYLGADVGLCENAVSAWLFWVCSLKPVVTGYYQD